MDIYFRSLASENWSKVGNDLVSTSLETSVAATKAYCFLNPTALADLGGTKDNTIAPMAIYASSLMSNTLHQTLSASDFSYENWVAKGWELDSLEIFKSQLKTWLLANFLPFSVLNPNNSINAYVMDKTVSGTRYVIPLIYIGDQGTLIETITANMSISYPSPIYTGSSFTVSGTVFDNGNPIPDVSVTVSVDSQSETAISDENGDFNVSFNPISQSGSYTLSWAANINGTVITKTRPFVISAIQAESVTVTFSPTVTTHRVLFTAIATVSGNNTTLNNAPISLRYNGIESSGVTDADGKFSADFIADSSITSLTYDAVTISGSSSVSVSTLQSVSISTTPSNLIDENSFTVSATVRNALTNLVPNALTSITYDGVTVSGSTNTSGVFTTGSFTAMYGVNSLSYNVQNGILTGSYNSTVGKTTSRLASITASAASPNPVITEEPFNVVVTAYDQYSTVFPNALIQIRTDDSVLGSGTTNASGVATISSLAPDTSGSYSIYAASGSVSSSAQVLTVDLPPPVASYMIISDPNPSDLFIGNSFTILVTVYTQYDQIFLDSVIINITDGSNILGTGTSNSSTGQVTISCSAPFVAGTYQIYAVSGTATSDAKTLNVSE